MPPGLRTMRLAACLSLSLSLFSACKDNSGPPEDRVTDLTFASGNLQGGLVGEPLGSPVVATALDAQGRGVAGAQAVWTVTGGGGSITAVSTTTDREGHTSANWILGQTAGVQLATVTVGNASLAFNATAAPGLADGVDISPSTLTLDAIDATAALTASAVDEYGNAISSRSFTWTSLNANIVSVSSTGVVTARMAGSTQVQATLDNVTAMTDVTVAPTPAQITLSPASAQLTAVGNTAQFQAASRDRNGHSITLQPSDYTWSTVDPVVATVDAAGLVRAVGSGSTQVRAAVGNVSGNAQVTVTQTADSLAVAPRLDTLSTAKPSRQLTAVAYDDNHQVIQNPTLTWTTADATIATVSTTGLVTAVANGTVIIRVSSGMAKDSATIVVRLNTPPNTVNDLYGAVIDMPLVVTAPGVLSNDALGIPAGTVTSFGGGSLGGSVTTNTAGATVMFGTGGSLLLSANGSFSFMPSAGFNGPFTFMYRVQTVAGMSDATVTIEVGNPPVATDDAYMTTMDVPLSVTAPGVLSNDNAGFPVATVVSFGGGSLGGTVTTFNAGQLVAFGAGGFAGGQVRLMSDGTLTFTPPTGYTGTFTVMYRLGSNAGSSDATITITVAPMPAPDR